MKENEIIEELPTKKKNLTSKSGNDIIVDNKGIPTEIKKEVKAEYQQFPTFLKSEKPDFTLRKMVKDVDREYRPKVNTKSTIRKLFNKEQNYRDFINKIGKHDLRGLSDDEIAVKLDQIMDWNNKKIT